MSGKVKKSFVLHCDMYAPTMGLSLEQKGQLWDAVFKFSMGEEVELSDPLVTMAFSFIRQILERHTEAYEQKCAKNRENIGKRWEKQSEANTTVYDRIQTNTTEYDRIRQDTKAYDEKVRIVSYVDSDSDSDNDSDSDINISSENILSEYSCRNSVPTPTPPDAPVKEEAPAAKRPSCPVQEIVKLYHATLPECPQVKMLSKSRERAIHARWGEIGDRLREQGRTTDKAARMEYLTAFFNRAAESDFLQGRRAMRDGSTYIVTFDKLMSPSGFLGVIEGKYDNR